MKKLLALILVLGLATTANAVITGSLTGDSTVGAGSMQANVAGGDVTYMAIEIVGTGTITISLGAAAPSDCEIAGTPGDVGLSGTGELWGMADFSSPYVYTDGVWFDIDYSGAVEDDVVNFWDMGPGADAPNLLGSITIPEPITLALLGLGGLFIRRK